MRLGDLHEEQIQNYHEGLRDRLKNIFQNISGGVNRPVVGGKPNLAQSAGNAVGTITRAFDNVKQGVRGQVDAFKQGIDGGSMKSLTTKEKIAYETTDRFLKTLKQINNRYQRVGVQITMPVWNPATQTYNGRMTIDDNRFDQARMQSIYEKGVDPVPQAQRTREDNQIAAALQELKKADGIIVGAGADSKPTVANNGVEIRFNMGQNQNVLKSAIMKMNNIDLASDANEEQVNNLTPQDLAQAIRADRVNPLKVKDEKLLQAALATIDLINKQAPLTDQIAALAIVKLIDDKQDMKSVAQALRTNNVAPGVAFDVLGNTIGLDNAKKLLEGLGAQPPRRGLNIKKAMDLVQTALNSDEIQNISDLDKMDDAKLAITIERGRIRFDQLSKKQVNRLLKHYKFPNPSSDTKQQIEQLALIIKAKVGTLDPDIALTSLQDGTIDIEQLKAIKPSNTLIQGIVRAAGETIDDSNRDAILNQISQIVGSKVKAINWQDPNARQGVDPKDLIKAIADNKITMADLTKEEVDSLFNPSGPAAAEMEKLPIEILSEVMPEVIDKGHVQINNATAKQLQAYLKGKGFQERLSGNLAGLRQQARDFYAGEKMSSIPKQVAKDAIEILKDMLDDDNESYKELNVRSAVNIAFKDIQSNEASLQRFIAIDEDDQPGELAKMARTIYYKRAKTNAPGSDSKETPETSTQGPEDPKVRRSANEALIVLERIKKAKQGAKEELLTLANELVKKGEKPGTDDFVSNLVTAYRQKFP